MLDTLFIDLDNTLLDFYATEAHVLGKALQANGIAPTPEVEALYRRINEEQWALLEKGRVTVEEVGERRFVLFLEALHSPADARTLSDTYDRLLKACCFYMPGAVALLETLQPHYHLFMMTNGVEDVQYGRIQRAQLAPYFERIFVSSEIGHAKPSLAFFEACFAQIPGFDRQRAAILGDGLNSDIRGGLQAGIRTLWFNPEEKPNATQWQPHAEVHALNEVPAILEKWNVE